MIFIPGNIPSLKNSKVATKQGIFSSPTVTKFLRSVGIQSFNSRKKFVKGYVDPSRPNEIEKLRSEFQKMLVGKGKPIFIGYHQVRNSKSFFDFSNSVEIVQDLFTAHDFIDDDDVSNVFPIPMTFDGELPTEENVRTEKFYSVDKEKPGVYIKIF